MVLALHNRPRAENVPSRKRMNRREYFQIHRALKKFV
jgi:hypothetical protein